MHAVPRPRAVDQTLKVDNRVPFQTDWLGVGANYMGFAAFPELALTPAQQTLEFDRAEATGIKLVSTWYGNDWAMATYPAGVADWASAKMTAFYTWLQAMKDRGINVFLKMGWHFPNDVCGISTPLAPVCTPTAGNETTWAAWVSESLNQIINERAFTNVIGVQFFTEPSTATGTIPVGYGSAQEYYVHVVGVAKAKIIADDASRTPIRPRISLVGPNEFANATDGNAWTEYIMANAPTLLDVITSHPYCFQPEFAPLGLTASACPGVAGIDTLVASWADDADPLPLWCDEGANTLVGGDTDATGYRLTCDEGVLMCRILKGMMDGGAQAAIMWMIQDQVWVGSVPYSQQFGAAKYTGTSPDVKPAWFALSMFANLTGGGRGTQLFRCLNGTSTLHATGVYLPSGVRNVVHSGGEWSIVVINEGAPTVGTRISFVDPIQPSPAGRTWYRYTYSGEIPAPGTEATPLAWDQKFDRVKTGLPVQVIPGRSVVIYSTINLNAGAVNLALAATATADSTGSGSPTHANDGNFSNVDGARNGWKKAIDAAQALTLEWIDSDGDPVTLTVGRVRLAFVATTVGQVYATYTDTSQPAPVADYTIEYWDGAGWVEVVDVTGNALPNREHSFGLVATTKIRLTIASVAATGQVNQLGVYEV